MHAVMTGVPLPPPQKRRCPLAGADGQFAVNPVVSLWRCAPESFDRQCAQAVTEGLRMLSAVKNVSGDESVTEPFLQVTKPCVHMAASDVFI